MGLNSLSLARVDHAMQAMRRVVEKVGGCIVWGGSVQLSPADDVLIRVSRPLDLDGAAPRTGRRHLEQAFVKIVVVLGQLLAGLFLHLLKRLFLYFIAFGKCLLLVFLHISQAY